MAYTETQLAQLQANMAAGLLRARVGDEDVQFRSLREMERIEEKMKKELGLSTRTGIMQVQTKSAWR